MTDQPPAAAAAPPRLSGAGVPPLLHRASALLDTLPPEVAELRTERDHLLASIDGHLLNRLRHPASPLVVAVAGPGGAGKSRLVNALVGQPASPEGPVRPTTRTPVVVTPGDRSGPSWSALVQSMRGAGPGLRVVDGGADSAAPDLVLVDLPAGSSWVPQLALADLCLLVTTPGRYADAATWALLDDVSDHGLPAVVVLNRTTSGDDQVVADLRSRLEVSPRRSALVVVEEGGDVDPLRRTLAAAATESEMRTRFAERLLAVADRLELLADAVEDRIAEESHLVATVDRHQMAAADEMRRSVEEREMPGAAARPWSETVDRLAGVVTHRIGDTSSAIAAAWAQTPLGADLVAGDGEILWRHAAEATVSARHALLAWPASVERLVAADARRSLRPAVHEALVGAVTHRALGGTEPVPRRLRRHLRSGLDEVADRARAALADIAADLVAADRVRYVERIGHRPDRQLPESLRKVADHLRDALPVPDGGTPRSEPGAGQENLDHHGTDHA